jgi:tetratricopeptide (TPR) repeat protein
MADLLDQEPHDPSLIPLWLDCVLDVTAHLSYGGNQALARRALALVESKSDPQDAHLAARAESVRSQLARAEGRLSVAAAHQSRTVQLHERSGNARAACEALGNLAVWLMEVGQLEKAEGYARQVLAMSESMRLSHFLGGVSQLLTNCLAYQGRLDEARAVGQRGLAWTRERGDRWFLPYVQLYLSMTEFLAADYPAAETLARGALNSTVDKPALRPFGLALFARARLAQGFGDEALALAKEAHAVLDAKSSVEDGEATVRLAYAEVLVASDNRPEAVRVVSEAMLWLRQRTQSLDDPALRVSFLERIPEHRRLCALAGELGIATACAWPATNVGDGPRRPPPMLADPHVLTTPHQPP